MTNNSNFTLQISSIDGVQLRPDISDANLLVDNRGLDETKLLTKLIFDLDGYARIFFSFNIGAGLPKNYMPHGIKIMDEYIYMTHNMDFTGPRSEIWNELRPTLDRTKHELGYWVPTPYYKLLSELLERKIFLEFPALWEESSGKIYGAIPTCGNLKGYLREKRVI